MKSLLIILIFSYLIFCLLLFLFQRSFLYFPQSASDVVGIPEIDFINQQQQLTGWVVNQGREKGLIYYGGNAESIEENIQFFQQVLPDHAVYLIPYRGYGNNSGKPTEELLYSDALLIFDQIKNRHQSMSLMGRSLGSGIATYVAVNRSVDKLVLVTPYDSIENVAKKHYPIFPVSLLVTDKYLSVDRAPNIDAKTLILIAQNDQVIPNSSSENLATRIRPELLSKIYIHNASHNDIALYPEYAKSLAGFLN